ncbi:MAG: prepilin-type N-terminal cleavage/methylation domain-containing protein [Gemmatimonadaceae bacterium]
MSTHSRTRRGVTLVELLVALVVFGVVTAVAMTFLNTQSSAVRVGSDRMGSMQNLQFGLGMLDQQLRTAGADVPDKQPYLVYAGSNVIVINADYESNVSGDPYAVYVNTDAPNGTVTAMKMTQQITIPNTVFVYPKVNYTTAGVNSPAETIIFYFALDTTTTRTDDYALYRQVNNDPAEIVSHNILATSGKPFFQYTRAVTDESGQVTIASVPSTSLPLAHTVNVHGDAADTGAASIIDSIRAVTITMTVTDGNTGAKEHLRQLSRLVTIPNAGLPVRQTCGDEPILGTGLTATEQTLASGDKAIQLQWSAATDESAGEKDVIRYVIWRRLATDTGWTDPYLSIPAGAAPYTYTDAAVDTGQTYTYMLKAQDCSPSLSTSGAVSASVTVAP